MPHTASNATLKNTVNVFTSSLLTSTGPFPKPSIGESIVQNGNHAYLYGGRDAEDGTPMNDLYFVDLETGSWKLVENQGPIKPTFRYFHSGIFWNNNLVFFGGIGFDEENNSLCSLNSTEIFDLETKTWRVVPPEASNFANTADAETFTCEPLPRYGHLYCVLGDYMIVYCGQDLSNNYIEQINAFDLRTEKWVHRSPLAYHCGVYRSNCISLDRESEFFRFCTSEDATERQDQFVGSLLFYLNSNFVDVKRELILLKLYKVSDAERNKEGIDEREGYHPGLYFEEENVTEKFVGTSMPPGLRFPRVYMVGDNLVLSGIYLTSSRQAFVLWVYSLDRENWIQLDTLGLLNHGSWFKCLCMPQNNQLVIFGNQTRRLIQDYNIRQSNYDNVVYIELEAYGVYRRPKIPHYSERSEKLGKLLLTGVSDMEILTLDRNHIPCLSKILYKRWPKFQRLLDQTAENNQDAFRMSLSEHGPQVAELPFTPINSTGSRMLYMPYSFETCTAFLYYLYCGKINESYLSTKTLCNLLILAKHDEGMETFFQYIVHLLHKTLNQNNVKTIYEIAVLTGAKGLQLRALRRIARIEQNGVAISNPSFLPNLENHELPSS
ncbi:Ras1-Scd pathway protein Ral2 [Schizosaccharomyces osmophilus]|uniref:Ras1-Scd pathway protein Ral2 n=1 Tax=Schizosaccharomyces osmophilus TaxID=2545709 RepID=A0AAE9W9H4_9SCHI|nr:Ras1-Scd pathway protein Ral2 [Schizosaccharomyces osmophilus]WBW71833.1 Ras1-Scd pathway protein Ral2 [Schizosaccharomyces osmophilus]